MKRKLYPILFVCMAVVAPGLFIACDDDEGGGEDDSKNFVMVGDKQDDLSNGLIQSFGEWDEGVYNHDLFLHSADITIDFENEMASGVGSLVYFELFTNNKDDFNTGTYTYQEYDDIGDAVPKAMTFDYADFVYNVDVGNDTLDWEELEDYYEITAGRVTIAKSGNDYTIDIDCTVNGGMNLKGNYTGPLPFSVVEYDFKKATLSKKLKF